MHAKFNDYFYFLKNKCTQKFPIRKLNKEVFYKDLETLTHLDKNLIITLKHFNTFCHLNNINEKTNEYKSLVIKLNNLFFDIVKRKENDNRQLMNIKKNNKNSEFLKKIINKKQFIIKNNNIDYLRNMENLNKLKYVENMIEKKEKNNLIKMFKKEDTNKENYKDSFLYFKDEISDMIDIIAFEDFFKKFKSFNIKIKINKKITFNKNRNLNIKKSFKNLIIKQKSFYNLWKLNKILNKENLLFDEELKIIRMLKNLDLFLNDYLKKNIWELNFFKFISNLKTIKIENIFSNNVTWEINPEKKFIINNVIKRNKNFSTYRNKNTINIQKLKIDSINLNKVNNLNMLLNKKSKSGKIKNNFLSKINNKTNENNNFNNKSNVEYWEIDNLKLLIIRLLYKKIINYEHFLRFIQVFKVSDK